MREVKEMKVLEGHIQRAGFLEVKRNKVGGGKGHLRAELSTPKEISTSQGAHRGCSAWQEYRKCMCSPTPKALRFKFKDVARFRFSSTCTSKDKPTQANGTILVLSIPMALPTCRTTP